MRNVGSYPVAAASVGSVAFSSLHHPANREGSAFFSGQLSFVQVPLFSTVGTPSAPTIRDYSLSLWLMPVGLTGTATGATIGPVAVVRDPSGTYAVLAVRLTATSLVQLDVLTGVTDAGSSYAGGYGNVAVVDATWNHVAVTVSADNTCLLYVNGALALTLLTVPSASLHCTMASGCGVLEIGATQAPFGGPPSSAFTGYISDVQVFSVLLTTAQVYATFMSPFTLPGPLASNCPNAMWTYYSDEDGSEGRDSCFLATSATVNHAALAGTLCPAGSHLLTIRSTDRLKGLFNAVWSKLNALRIIKPFIGCLQSSTANTTVSGWSWVDGTSAVNLNCLSPSCGLWGRSNPDDLSFPNYTEGHRQDYCSMYSLGIDDVSAPLTLKAVCEYDVASSKHFMRCRPVFMCRYPFLNPSPFGYAPMRILSCSDVASSTRPPARHLFAGWKGIAACRQRAVKPSCAPTQASAHWLL